MLKSKAPYYFPPHKETKNGKGSLTGSPELRNEDAALKPKSSGPMSCHGHSLYLLVSHLLPLQWLEIRPSSEARSMRDLSFHIFNNSQYKHSEHTQLRRHKDTRRTEH